VAQAGNNLTLMVTDPISEERNMKTKSYNPLVTGLCAAALATFSLSPLPASAAGTASDLVLSKTWMKLIVPSRPAAGYFTVENHGKSTVKLIGASSPGCGSLMLHHSAMKNGVMEMRMVKDVPVEAGGTLSFQPGGYHLMCMEPNEKVRPGKTVPVTLKFDNGTTLTKDFPVKDARGKM
jgi:periplasmic copper chaperone A